MRDDERFGRSKEVRTPDLIGQIKNFIDKDRRVSIETISAQFDVSVGTVHTNIREKLKMRKICVKTIETIEEMKEAVTKVIDTLTLEDFHGAFQKLLEWYNKCIAVGGDYFEGDYSFMCVLSIKVPIRKKSGNLFNDPRISLLSYFVKIGTHYAVTFIIFSYKKRHCNFCCLSTNISLLLKK